MDRPAGFCSRPAGLVGWCSSSPAAAFSRAAPGELRL